MEKVEWGWVVMGKPDQMQLWQKHWDSQCKKVHIINNNSGDTFGFPGSNRHFEFSGYQELISQFQTEGPYLIVNDTWFKTHSALLWTKLLKRFLKKPKNDLSIYGDIRREASSFEEKPSPYLSSWVFFIPNRKALEGFALSLEKAIFESSRTDFTAKYKQYVEDWIQPRNALYGWHLAQLTSEALERKRQCIFMEHSLNKELLREGFQLKGIGYNQKILYALIRLVDRLQTRLFAWGLHPFA